MAKLAIFLVVTLCVAIISFEPAAGECCNLIVPGCSKCADGTERTPFCGYGPCNIFGCNCDGGCRTGPMCPGKEGLSDPYPEVCKEYIGIPCHRFSRFSKWARWRRSAKDNVQVGASSAIELIDLDGDNMVNNTEGYAYVTSEAGGNFTLNFKEFEIHFAKLDRNGDGKLTQDEIDDPTQDLLSTQ